MLKYPVLKYDSKSVDTMFSGIVAATGRITEAAPSAAGLSLSVAPGTLDMSDIFPGDSIAHAGVCLTVTKKDSCHYYVDVSPETLRCSVGLDELGEVNLEKALRLNDYVGGHLVSGHVDGVGEVLAFDPAGDNRILKIRAPHAISRYIARKGSIAVNGCSLTTNTAEGDIFTINLIPHTLSITTLKYLAPGSRVNLEIDLMARYAERLLEWESQDAKSKEVR